MVGKMKEARVSSTKKRRHPKVSAPKSLPSQSKKGSKSMRRDVAKGSDDASRAEESTAMEDVVPGVAASLETVEKGGKGKLPVQQDDDGSSEEGAHSASEAEEERHGSTEDGKEVVNFGTLEGIGDHSDSSDEDAPLETLALARLPGQVVSEIRNDEPALEKKLADIAIFTQGEGKKELTFWDSLTVTMSLQNKLADSLAMNDLKREQRFAELATAAVHEGLGRLRKQKVKFRRPTDYFAQMVKTDVQMGKVKARILHQKEQIESAEKRRNNREIAKNKKKVRSTQLQKEQEKKRKANEEIEAFSRLRKQRLKERASSAGQDADDDDEFPIELLEVEQLDAENKFRPESEIASGKRKAWSENADKLSKTSAPERKGGIEGGKGKRGSQRMNDGSQNKRASDQGHGTRRQGVVGGVRKPKGSKKRLGRNRRKASAK